MPIILFICTANQVRSPLSVRILQDLLQKKGITDWQIESAGTWAQAGYPAPAEALQACQSLGVESGPMQNHRSREVNSELIKKADLVITMETSQQDALQSEFPTEANKIFTLSQLPQGIRYDIPDPYKHDIPIRQVAVEIQQLLIKSVDEIIRLAGSI